MKTFHENNCGQMLLFLLENQNIQKTIFEISRSTEHHRPSQNQLQHHEHHHQRHYIYVRFEGKSTAKKIMSLVNIEKCKK